MLKSFIKMVIVWDTIIDWTFEVRIDVKSKLQTKYYGILDLLDINRLRQNYLCLFLARRKESNILYYNFPLGTETNLRPIWDIPFNYIIGRSNDTLINFASLFN